MNPMDRVTLHGLFVWAVFIVCPLVAVAVIRRELRQRRKDMAWAAGVARKVQAKEEQCRRDAECLRWLDANTPWEDEKAGDAQ